jgi:hypothetical protein
VPSGLPASFGTTHDKLLYMTAGSPADVGVAILEIRTLA